VVRASARPPFSLPPHRGVPSAAASQVAVGRPGGLAPFPQASFAAAVRPSISHALRASSSLTAGGPGAHFPPVLQSPAPSALWEWTHRATRAGQLKRYPWTLVGSECRSQPSLNRGDRHGRLRWSAIEKRNRNKGSVSSCCGRSPLSPPPSVQSGSSAPPRPASAGERGYKYRPGGGPSCVGIAAARNVLCGPGGRAGECDGGGARGRHATAARDVSGGSATLQNEVLTMTNRSPHWIMARGLIRLVDSASAHYSPCAGGGRIEKNDLPGQPRRPRSFYHSISV
jgi:hypothetical protein